MDKGMDFGSPDIRVINAAPKVALLSGEQTSSLGAGEIWHFFDKQLDYPLTLVNVNDLARFNLKNYQVLIIPDGFYRNLTDKPTTDKLKDFVRSGGKLIAMESAAEQLAGADWGFKLKEDKSEDKSEYAALKKFADQERNALTGSIPGAIYKVDLDNTHPLAFGFPDFYYTLKQDANLFEFMKSDFLKKKATPHTLAHLNSAYQTFICFTEVDDSIIKGVVPERDIDLEEKVIRNQKII
jgi:hypothetical protein